jgi:AGZA family xanthine/uracil permease-like MFS transporter
MTAKIESQPTSGYRWFVLGDINGFFTLAFDNLTVLSFLAGILIFAFKFPADVVYTRMFPGTAFGVLFGDIVYTWMAFRLAKKMGKSTITAMPLGLDTPSTIGIALVVLGPAFLGLKADGMSEHDAAMMTWYIGMATMVIMGVVKVGFSFMGSWIQRIVPQAGLLGSLAGIGLALIGFVPFVDLLGIPIIGMVALGLIFYTLIARIDLPGKIPGVFAAVVAGTVLYYILGPLGWAGGTYTPPPAFELHFGLPLPTFAFIHGLGPALKYLPLSIPFGLLTIAGGINVTESARVAGDEYNVRQILLTEAVATLVAGICGGVAQQTPYIGHPAYKKMGCRAGYTLITGIVIGLGGIFGYVSFFVELIPRAAIAPILLFVGLDIISQSFRYTPPRHLMAVALAFFPTVARLIAIKLSNPDFVPPDVFQKLLTLPGKALPELLVTIALGNGFIITGMLWGGFLAELIDRHFKKSIIYLIILAGLTMFGVIHSALPDGSMYFPWMLSGLAQGICYQFTTGYLVLAVMIFLLSRTSASREPFRLEAGEE